MKAAVAMPVIAETETRAPRFAPILRQANRDRAEHVQRRAGRPPAHCASGISQWLQPAAKQLLGPTVPKLAKRRWRRPKAQPAQGQSTAPRVALCDLVPPPI